MKRILCLAAAALLLLAGCGASAPRAADERLAYLLEYDYSILADGRLVFAEHAGMRDLTTDEIWNKLHTQVFYSASSHPEGGPSRQEAYILYTGGVFRFFPGHYMFDGGGTPLCATDLDGDGVYELLAVFHAGSGVDARHLSGCLPGAGGAPLVCDFGTLNNPFRLVKEDDETVHLEFSAGGQAGLALVYEHGIPRMEVVLPDDLPDETARTILRPPSP